MKLFKNIVRLTVAFVTVSFFTSAQQPLLIPPVLTGPTFNLNVTMDSTEFFPGIKTPTYGYNGNILGPTLILNKGETVTMNVTNNINTTTTVHWHGLHVPAYADGGPHQIISRNTTWSTSFTVMNNAATFWYHPHGENKTDIQVTKGLAGFILVKDSAENSLTLPRTYGVDDIPLVFQTKSFDMLYQTAIATMYDTVAMVNATINPYLDVPAQVVRLRLLNGASHRSFNFGFSNNQSFSMIGSDGGLLPAPVVMNRLLLSPGERAEILIDLNGKQGQTIQLVNYGTQIPTGVMGALTVGNGMAQIPDYNLNPLNGADFNLLQLNVSPPTANPVSSIPSTLVPLSPFDTSLINRNRSMLFAPQVMSMQNMVQGPFTINGNQFNMMVVNDTTYLNDVERWTLSNQTLVAHPFHIHDVQFLISRINGALPPAHEAGWKDVVLVMPQQSVTFLTKFQDFADDSVPYMYHCHLLHHEDDGMMGSFVVLNRNNGIEDAFPINPLSIYPNPVDATLSFEENLRFDKIIITNAIGKTSIEKSDIRNSTINVANLSAGYYTLTGFTKDNTIYRGRFIKN